MMLEPDEAVLEICPLCALASAGQEGALDAWSLAARRALQSSGTISSNEIHSELSTEELVDWASAIPDCFLPVNKSVFQGKVSNDFLIME